MAAPKQNGNDGAKLMEAVPEERWVAARALYEGTPGITMRQVAAQTGLSYSTLSKKASAENWKKNYAAELGGMTEQAQKAADMFTCKVEEIGPEITTEEKATAAAEVALAVAVDLRAQVLDRHRKEWGAVRVLSAEALKIRGEKPGEAFDRAKLAKITAETLKIAQDGERKAWGLDVGELPPGNVVVIERA